MLTLKMTPGIDLIKRFEGCVLHAYPDPLKGWAVPTIGYGTIRYSSGQPVQKGDEITLQQAEDELRHEVEVTILPRLRNVPHFDEMSERMQGALVSFAYNLGAGFYGDANFQTITRKLREHSWQTMRNAFVLYRNPGTNVEAGLLARRNAEADEWEAGLRDLESGIAPAMPAPTPAAPASPAGPEFGVDKFVDFFRFFNRQNPNHVSAVKMLGALLPEEALSDDAEWVKLYRKKEASVVAEGELKLEVPYFSQVDSQAPGQAMRMCFSSSNAMLVAFLNPGMLNGPNSDDDYLRRVLHFGDTTDATAQIRALATFGVQANLQTNLSWRDIDHELEQGRPVPIGILHHGAPDHPTGGGHWIVVVGRSADNTAYIVHDPAGDLDLINGVHNSSVSGAFLRYSKKNTGPRWMVEGEGTGWGIIVHSVS